MKTSTMVTATRTFRPELGTERKSISRMIQPGVLLPCRHYDPHIGRFISLDEWTGDTQDPQSLHKYAYVHGDPVNGIDPTGQFFTYVGQLAVTYIRAGLQSRTFLFVSKAWVVLDRAQTIQDAFMILARLVAGGGVDPAMMAGLLASIIPFQNILQKAKFVGKRLMHIGDDMKEAYEGFVKYGDDAKDAVRQLGDLGSLSVGKKLGFDFVEDFPTHYHGIDGLMKNGDRFVIVEAKGGSSVLGVTKSGEQLSKNWIKKKIDVLSTQGPLEKEWAKKLRAAMDNDKLDVMHVRTPIEGVNAYLPEYELRDFTTGIGATTFDP